MPNPRIYPPRVSSSLPQASDLTPDSEDECLNVYASLDGIDESDNDVKSSILEQVTRYRNLTVSVRKSDKSGRRFAVFTFDNFEALNTFKRSILEIRERIIVFGKALFFNFYNNNNEHGARGSRRVGASRNGRGSPLRRDRSRSRDSPDRNRTYDSRRISEQSRTLFVGNLDEKLEAEDIQQHFEPFGEILDIVVKHPTAERSAPYAFIKFKQLSAALNARDKLQDTFIGQNRAKIGFGKANPSSVIWIGGLNENTTEKELSAEIKKHSRFVDCKIIQDQNIAYYLFYGIPQCRKVYTYLQHVRLNSSGAVLEVDYADPQKEAADLIERNKSALEQENGSTSSPRAHERNERESRTSDGIGKIRRRKRDSRSSSYVSRKRSPILRYRRGDSNHSNAIPYSPIVNRARRSNADFSHSETQSSRRGQQRETNNHDTMSSEFTFGQRELQSTTPSHASAKGLSTILSVYPVVWRGGIVIKGQVTNVQLHLICGSIDPISTMVYQATLNGKDPLIIHLTGRIPLSPDRVSDIRAKIATAINTKDCCVAIAQAWDTGRNNRETSYHDYKPLFKVISYFQDKGAAGVDKIGISKMYVFPPSEFAQDQLSTLMPHVASVLSTPNVSYLMVVVTK